MFKGHSILVVIPARGGSKGIQRKNIYPVLGKPLISYTIDVCKDLTWIDEVIVSTDDLEIAKLVESLGVKVPFLRPKEISGDFISDHQVIKHALFEVERLKSREFDFVMMLQPTSPLRSCSDVESTINYLIEGGFDSVWTVSPVDSKYHALKQLTISDSKRLEYFSSEGEGVIARQQLNPTFIRNGVAYAMARSVITDGSSLLGNSPGALVIDSKQISIDTLEDIKTVEAYLSLKDSSYLL
jgi:CMP-N-acetylneuraminic acid synthetase